MTVKELIEKLATMEPTREVILSRDEEGNGYANLTDVEDSACGSPGEPCHPDDADEDFDRVVVLWP